MTQLQLLTTKEAICKGVLVVCTFTATHICNAHWGTRLSSPPPPFTVSPSSQSAPTRHTVTCPKKHRKYYSPKAPKKKFVLGYTRFQGGTCDDSANTTRLPAAPPSDCTHKRNTPHTCMCATSLWRHAVSHCLTLRIFFREIWRNMSTSTVTSALSCTRVTCRHRSRFSPRGIRFIT